MEKVQPQRTELYEYLYTYMEELFQDSCRAVQTILDTDSAKIWEYFQAAVCECLEKTKSLQQQNQKGVLHYLAFSPMQYAPFLDRLELRIDALDDGFYLDTQEASAHYYVDFLQDRFQEDLAFLYEKAAEKFIRIQHFEQVQIRQNYAVYYDSLLFQMIRALTGLILETECILCKITDNNTGRKYINPNQIHRAVTAAADVFEAIKKCHPRHEGHWILSLAPPQPIREQP